MVAAVIGSGSGILFVGRDSAADHTHVGAIGRAASHTTGADRDAGGTWLSVFPGRHSSDVWLSTSTNAGPRFAQYGQSTRFFSSRGGRAWPATGALDRLVTTFAYGGMV